MYQKVKILTIAAMALLLTAVAGCKKDENSAKYPSGNAPSKVDIQTNIGGVESLLCFTIDDYDFNAMMEQRARETNVSAPGCSEVRRGNTVVRNLDWFQWDQATFLVALKHTDKHLASLNVCGTGDMLTHTFDSSSFTLNDANMLLAYTNDGMNEKGVYVGVNVVPYGQMSLNGGTGDIQYRPTSGPNKDKAPLLISYLTRLVLDHATDLKSAEEIIKGTPWDDFSLLTQLGFQCHWLVCTEEGSFVCEFVDNKPQFIHAESTNSPDYGNIMTNFSNYIMSQGIVQSHGAGYERWQAIADNYATATPKELAELVFYTKMYRVDYNDPGYFWTEWASDDYTAQQLMTWRDNTESRKGDLWNQWLGFYHECQGTFDPVTHGYDYDRSRGSWYTAHTSIWDLAAKAVNIDIEEQNAFAVTVSLDGTVSKN